MARPIHKLTPLGVARTQRRGYYSDGGGLYLQVSRAEAKSWVFRYRVGGKRREMGLGSLRLVSLAEAREEAAEYRRMCRSGRDPITERKLARLGSAEIMTFAECADACVEAHRPEWGERHWKQWVSTLTTYVYPIIGDLPVQAINTRLVVKVLKQETRRIPDQEPGPLWAIMPVTAGRIRERIEKVLDYAKALDYRQGENPARWTGHLEHLLARLSSIHSLRHHPAVDYHDMPSFVSELREYDEIASVALELTILTAARTSEVLWMPWSEIDFENRIWTVPKERMKGTKEDRQEHQVPLSDPAISILRIMEQFRDESDFVFAGTKKGQPVNRDAMRRLIRRMGRAEPTVHGFRATFGTWAEEECTDVEDNVIEKALAHKTRDKVKAAYRRGTLLRKRRPLMEAWANFCTSAP